MAELTQERLKELLHYDPETGVFTWKMSTRKTKPGQTAGGKHTSGHVRISIDGKRYYAHRLAWMYINGYNPSTQIDHRNVIRSDNSSSNLREATHAQNCQNSSISRNNSSGFKGVTFSKAANKWAAQISVNRKHIHLGLFLDPADAHLAYKKAATEYFGEFARTE